MSDQLSLVGPSTPPDLKLTKRQRFSLEFIAHRPPSSEELGAALHEYRMQGGGRGHRAENRCDWCQAEGAHMGNRLRQLKLVRFARGLGVWYLAESGKPKAVSGSQSDDIPF
ncbi:MAG: hypothetical protein K0S82_11 [Gaiellaceae bacterium]|jgi:hypothetical protein|nr:hypothetical protein [Gaiellaceae bacterium]